MADDDLFGEEDLHTVLETCGITNEDTRNTIINQEGFDGLADLGVLETDADVTEMAKRMATRAQAEGRVLLGTVVIKRLQTLVWWVRDRQKRGLNLDGDDFNVDAMNKAAEMKALRRDRAEKEPSVSDLGKFDPDDFDSFEDAFLNLLAQSYGVLKEPLRYITRKETPPAEFVTNEEERMYQFSLVGESFQLDNQTDTGSSKHSSLIHLDGHGSNLTIRPRMVKPPIWHGRHIITVRAS
jgi:hypothetical protein